MKSSLTPEGVEQKLHNLYLLTDTALATEAESIKLDFKGWVKNNFNLSSQQLAYVDGIDSKTESDFGEQCALCFTHRLNIVLIYPDPPETPGYAKWTGSSNNIVIQTDGAGNNNVTGSLTFTIGYT